MGLKVAHHHHLRMANMLDSCINHSYSVSTNFLAKSFNPLELSQIIVNMSESSAVSE